MSREPLDPDPTIMGKTNRRIARSRRNGRGRVATRDGGGVGKEQRHLGRVCAERRVSTMSVVASIAAYAIAMAFGILIVNIYMRMMAPETPACDCKEAAPPWEQQWIAVAHEAAEEADGEFGAYRKAYTEL